MKKLRTIYFISIPLFACLFILLSFGIPDISIFRPFFFAIGCSLVGAFAVVVSERLIIGDPYDRFNKTLEVLRDAHDSGLIRIITDRNSYVYGSEIADLVRNAKTVQIFGTVLSFVVQNNSLYGALEQSLSHGGHLHVVLAHPHSESLKQRDDEEGWGGTLPSRLRSTVLPLLKLKKRNMGRMTISLFKGECHNTVIATERHILMNSYVFGQKGWKVPMFLFARADEAVSTSCWGQFGRLLKYAESNPSIMVNIDSEGDVKREFF